MKRFFPVLLFLSFSLFGQNAQAHGHHNSFGATLLGTAIISNIIYDMVQPRYYIAPPVPIYTPQPVYIFPPQPVQYQPTGLPYGARVININGFIFYEYNGVFYQRNIYGEYIVVPPPRY